MTPVSCDDFRKWWDLLLDGALRERDSEAAREHLEACAGCRTWLREEAALSDALAGWYASPGCEPARRESGVSVIRQRWTRAVATVAAAAAVFVLGWSAGALIGSGGSAETGPRGRIDDIRSGAVLVADGSGVREARLGCGSTVRLLPGSGLEVLDGGALSRVALRQGSVEIHAADQGVELDAGALGSLRVTGVATITDAGVPDEPLLLVNVLFGGATVLRMGQATEIPAGVPHLLGPRGAAVVRESLDRLDHLLADEEMVVLTSEQFVEMEGTTEAERERLQERIGQLMAENNRLQLENDVLRRGQESPRVLSARDLVLTLADAAGERDSWGPEQWGRVRAVRHLLQDRLPEAEAAILELLLDPSQPESRQRLGLNLIGTLRSPSCSRIVAPWLRHQNRELRGAAVDALSWQRGPEVQEQLTAVFRTEVDDSILVSAAGGLVRLGDTQEPLQWLMRTYERKDAGRQLRQRILGRVLFAPVQESGRFLVGVLTSPEMDAATAREVIEQIARLGRFGGRRSGDLLDFLAYALPDPGLRECARRLSTH